MTDEGVLRQRVNRADRAKRILEDELIKEAFEKIESTIDYAWKNSKADDEEARHNAYLMLRLLQDFKEQFHSVITTGRVSERELLRVNQQKSKVRKLLNV